MKNKNTRLTTDRLIPKNIKPFISGCTQTVRPVSAPFKDTCIGEVYMFSTRVDWIMHSIFSY